MNERVKEVTAEENASGKKEESEERTEVNVFGVQWLHEGDTESKQ